MEETFCTYRQFSCPINGSERENNAEKAHLTKVGASATYGVINTIVGGIAGGGDSASQLKKYAKKEIRYGDRPKRSRTCFNVQFSDEDMEKVEIPHDDPILISSYISNYLVRRILVDTGSSVVIITIHTFNMLKRESIKLEPIKNPLIGFGGN
ncbi:hypothetical protein LIER_22547 [Lithospermum erythrorhizon]|uniref:Peptidase A2 domain-containing protein n=1 Tax=Lithospermum erythrorhizon TaxID=34254 RepID=A0AAV3R012_LITER